MESTKKLLTSLLDLGLNKYEANAYLTLVAEGTSTAKNISDITGIPYGKVYEIINSLSAKGFLITLPSKPMKFQAVAPQKVIAHVKERTSTRLTEVELLLNKELSSLFLEGKRFVEPKNIFWVISGRANINKKIDELIMNAGDSISILASENGIKRLVLHKEALLEASRRGVKTNIVTNRTNENIEDVGSLSFCTIRHAPNIQHQLISNGRESMLIESVPDDDNIIHGRDVGIWVSGKSFTYLFENLYAAFFQQASPAEPARTTTRSQTKNDLQRAKVS